MEPRNQEAIKETAVSHPFLSLAFPCPFSVMSFVALVGFVKQKKQKQSLWIFFFLPKHFSTNNFRIHNSQTLN
jgi:hypothetical protein